ncbi:MAG: 6,7-dimethyl-8-ribityllumazine synthase [Actinomycetota bacterium]
MKIIRGDRKGKGIKIGIVVSRFNQSITDRLLEGALEALKITGVSSNRVTVISVPGAFDIPAVAKRLTETYKPDAIVCLGAVIRGETEHFTYVCKSAQEGISAVCLEKGLPITFGILTTENLEQALARSAAGDANKGYEAARDAVELANTLRLMR